MNRRAAGVAFCAIAAFLFASRYMVAAIFGSNVNSWNAELFGRMLVYTGTGLLWVSGFSLIVGVVYLVAAETAERRSVEAY